MRGGFGESLFLQKFLDMQARTTVQAHLMRPDLLVEVTATAALPK